jgi:ABC-type spermidine/putrescine transport system permease subunit II
LRAWYRVMLPLASLAIVTSWLLVCIITFDDSNIAIFLSSATQTTYGAQILNQISNANSPSVAAAGTAVMLVTAVLVGLLAVAYRSQQRMTRAMRSPSM